jgi:glycosyltransferase involved in cell wall biosynthesis
VSLARTSPAANRSERATRRLTIGIDASRAFGVEQTGTERYATAVTQALVALGGHDYRLYLQHRTPLPPPEPASSIVLRAPRLWTHTRLALEVALRVPDVLFVPAHVLPAYTRPAAVVTVHDLGYLAYPEAHTAVQRRYLHWTTRRHATRATAVIADSAATRDDLVARYRADPDRVHVVHLAVEDAMRPAAPDEVAAVRAEMGIPPDRPYVLHVGTLQPRKNLPRLMHAFAGLASNRTAPVLVLAGKQGWGREDLPRMAQDLGIARSVRFAGYVPRKSLPALYTGATVAAVPSLYEGFGLPALEAMACGAPVAASRTSSLPEVVGSAGLLFDPEDTGDIRVALDRLLSDANLRASLSRVGRERAAAFTWDLCARRTLRVLERAAADGGDGLRP